MRRVNIETRFDLARAEVFGMKNVVDKLLADLLASTGFASKLVTVFCKDGFCYEVDVSSATIETNEECITLLGKITETTGKKVTKKGKRDAVIAWSEISRIETFRESE